ncbi:hypothetical protein ACFLYW_01810 [Thermodesulfobacteriota bacterium]
MEVPTRFRSVLAGFRYWLLALVFMATSALLVACTGGETIVISDNPTTTTTTTSSTSSTSSTTSTTTTTTSTTTTTTTVQADSLVLIVSPTDVFPDGTVDIDAYATYGGAPVINLPITFTLLPNVSGGNIEGVAGPITRYTDGIGKTSVTYTAGGFSLVATDVITVSANYVADQIINITVNPLVDDIDVRVRSGEPEELVADGTEQTIIEAEVRAGAATVVGVDVDFATTIGTICVDAICTGGTATSLTVPTDGSGIAEVYLQSVNVGDEEVTGETPTLGSTISGSAFVTFNPGDPAAIALTALPPSVTADGVSTSLVTATVTDALGHLVADGIPITFSVTPPGPGNYGSFPVDTAPTLDGIASEYYVAGTIAPVDVDIEATDGTAIGTTIIPLLEEEVGRIELIADRSELTVTGDQAGPIYNTTALTAYVYNTEENLIAAATPVTFATSPLGGYAGDLEATSGALDDDPTAIVSDTLIVNTAAGIATVYLQANQWSADYYTFSATAGTESSVVPIIFNPGPADPTESTLIASPATIPADGSSTSTLTLVAKDFYGNMVADPNPDPIENPPDGQNVTFTTTDGEFVLAPDPNDDTARASTEDGVLEMTLASSLIATSINAVEVHAFIDAIDEVAYLTFDQAVELDPHSIELEYSGGVDDLGTTLLVESPSGTNASTSRITATVLNGENPQTTIAYDCEDNIEFEIIEAPAGVKLDGLDEASDPVIKTTNNGVAFVNVTVGTAPGTVRVKVSVTKETAPTCNDLVTPIVAYTTAIVIQSGTPAKIMVFPATGIEGPTQGVESQIFNAVVTDAWDNPVDDGTSINFALTENPADAGGWICTAGHTGGPVECGDTNSTEIYGIARTRLSWAESAVFGTFYLKASAEFASHVSYTYQGNYPSP